MRSPEKQADRGVWNMTANARQPEGSAAGQRHIGSGAGVCMGMKRAPLLVLALVACSSPTEPGRDAAALMVTDADEYQLMADEWGMGTTIRYVFSNRTGRKVSLLNCLAWVPPSVEKLVEGEWEAALGAPTFDCLSAPVEIEPGAQYRDSLNVWSAHPERNAAPKFADPDVDGIYRLRWTRAYWDYDHDGPPWGEALPVRFVVSNTFRLRAP